MAYVAPSGHIKLYSGVQIIPGRQIAFSSKVNQTAYFASKLVQDYTPCTYVRRTYSVKAEVSMSVVKTCNYISFTNPDFENITWYAKIINYEYVNNACTEIFFAIDYFQTFMFDVNFEVCTIDREQLSVTDYNKSVTNPYDFSIVEMRTDESMPLPDEVFDYPAVYGSSYTNGPKRTFLPAGPEDSATYQLFDNLPIFVVVLAIDVEKVKFDSSNVLIEAKSTIPEEDMIAMLTAANINTAFQQTGNISIGYSVPHTKYRGLSDGSVTAVSAFADQNISNPSTRHYGYVSFGALRNNVVNPNLVIGVESYERLDRVMKIIAANDIVSSIQGCYCLPLSFCAMLHAQSVSQQGVWTTTYDAVGTPSYGDSADLTNNSLVIYKEEVQPIGFSEVKNKKLLTFPYQYIKVSDPDGEAKEYRFEDFTSLQNPPSGGLNPEDNFKVQFAMMADITNNPILNLMPFLYKEYNTTNTSGTSFRHKISSEDRMQYSGFPQQAYMTDAYLSYVAAQYSEQLKMDPMRENIKTQKYMYDNYEKWANKQDKYGAVGYVGSVLGNSGSSLGGENLSSIGASMQGIHNNIGMAQTQNMKTAEFATNIQKNEAALNLRTEARNWADTGEIGTQLAAAKPAFRANNYVAGGGTGTMPYLRNGFRFTFDVMKLKPAFLSKFDEYFTNYGYKSTRTGVPHIATYLGGTKTGNAPKFLQNAQGYYVTYIKTVDCKVYSTMDLITEFFESLFNQGIQLIDGDTLLPTP